MNPIIISERAKAIMRGHIILHFSAKDKLKVKRVKLETLHTSEIEKWMWFTQQENYNGGPKSAYKLKQMKNSYITYLKLNQSKIWTDKNLIVEEFTCYYEKLW